MISLHLLPLCYLIIQGFHPGGPSVWAKGAGHLVSRGGAKLLLNFFPFLTIPQEMVATTIVALYPLATSPLGLLSTIARTTLALFLLWSFNNLDHLDSSPRRTLFDLRHYTLFLILLFLGSLAICLGPISTTIDLQTLGHYNGSLQISLHMGPTCSCKCGCNPDRNA